jgi:hypothetical protein
MTFGLGRDMPHLIPGTHPLPDDIVPGNPALCGCDDRSLCVACNEPVCPNHGDEVTECAEGGYHHLDDCAYYCTPCAAAAWDSAQHERADAIRKGEWDD